MNMCVLQVTPFLPNPVHVKMCKDNGCDFHFVTHDKQNKDAIAFCPNTFWSQTRTTLAVLLQGMYDYYAFVDYDYDIVSLTNKTPLQQLIVDLERWHPAVLIPYPGTGLSTPLAKNDVYFNSSEYTIDTFTHCGMKVIHKSLLGWFFPMMHDFDGGWSAAHMINLLELPFYRSIITTHNVKYNHTHVGGTKNDLSKENMDDMWIWLRDCIRWDVLEQQDWTGAPFAIEKLKTAKDSLIIKQFFTGWAENKKFKPVAMQHDVDYRNHWSIENMYTFDHQYMVNRSLWLKDCLIHENGE